MSTEVEINRPSGFTLALAERTIPRGEVTPDKDEVEARLRVLFTTLRELELEKTNALRTFVTTHDDWTVHPEGRKQAIDACISGENGEAFHIQLTCERSESLLEDTSLSKEEVTAIIRSEATEFRVLFYDKVAMDYIHTHADPNETLLNKVRGYHKEDPQTIQVLEDGHRAAFVRDPIYQFYLDGNHTAHAVPLTPVSIDSLVEEDIKSAFSHAQVNRAQNIVEAARHAEEYRRLHHELDASAHWPKEARQKLIDRMFEIQAINGYHGPILDWETVIIPADDDEDAILKGPDVWDAHTIEGLRQAIYSSAEMLVLEGKIGSRVIAAQALKILQATR